MFCNNCKKKIPDDSTFCVFCGFKIKKESIENNLLNNSRIVENQLIYSKESIVVKDKLENEIEVDKLIGRLKEIIESYKKQIYDLYNSNKHFQSEIKRLNNLLSEINKSRKINDGESNSINNHNAIIDKSFLNNVFRILEEFSLVSKYKNNQHSSAWSEDDPKEIKKEEAFLTKIKKLFNQLKDMQYPHNLIDERNKFVNIFEKLCHYKEFSINGMQNGNYKSVLINERAFTIVLKSLYNYYDSLIKKE